MSNPISIPSFLVSETSDSQSFSPVSLVTCTTCTETYCQQMCEDTSCQCTYEGGECGTCQSICQTTCEADCQDTCQLACQSTCQLSCQCGVEYCENCQATCEKSCQCSNEGCETCTSVCMDTCQCSVQNNQTPVKLSSPSLSNVRASGNVVYVDWANPNFNSNGGTRIHIEVIPGTSTNLAGSSGTWSYTGSYGTTYYFTAYCYDTAGINPSSNTVTSSTVTTASPPKLSAPTFNTPSVNGRTISIIITRTASVGTTTVNLVETRTSEAKNNITFTGSSYTWTVEAPSPNTEYHFAGYTYSSGYTDSDVTFSSHVTTGGGVLPDPSFGQPYAEGTTAYVNVIRNTTVGKTRVFIVDASNNSPISVADITTDGLVSIEVGYGTWYFKAWNYDPNAVWTDSQEIVSDNLAIMLPGFQWDTPKVKKQRFNLTAVEWNKFTSYINQVRVAKNLSQYTFVTAVKDNKVTAKMYNQTINAMSPMNPSYQLPDLIVDPQPVNLIERDRVTAQILNDLVNAINSVILT